MNSKMTTCKHCGAEIAKSAKVCPNCGGKNKKPIYKRVWFYIVIILILMVIIGAATPNTSTYQTDNGTMVNTSVKSEDDASVTEATMNDNTHKIYQIGNTVISDNIELTVTQAEYWTEYNTYLAPSEGKEIYRVYMEVKNIGNNDLFVTSPECYADDVVCDMYYYADNDIILDSISTGRKAAGWIYYEVPENAESIELEYETSYWFDEYVIFKVK